MTLPKPSWIVQTRPCPFYQQGSCFFADSCNFLHTVSASIITDALPSSYPADATPTPTNLPRVVVDSPSSVPPESPSRSPGTTSVLLALRLIDYDDPDVPGNESNATSQPDGANQDTLTEQKTAWSEALPTLVNEGFSIVDGILQEEYYTDDDMDDNAGNWTAISDYNDLPPQSSQNIDQEEVENLMPLVDDDHSEEDATVHVPVSSHPECDAQPSSEVNQSDPVDPSPHASIGLLSPIELLTLNLGPLRLDDNVVTEDDNSFDSGYADTWKPPNPLLSSPPHSPSISSTFDLLSSPFGTLSSRIASPYLGAFLTRSPASSARTISAILDDVPPLDLGLGSPEENTSPLVGDADNKSYASPHSSPKEQDLADVFSDSRVEDIKDEHSVNDRLINDHLLDHDSYDTSIWDSEGGSTAVFLGPDENYVREQVTTAIRRQSKSGPLHFLHSQDTNFLGDDALAQSSLDSADDEDASNSQPLSEPVEEEYDGSQVLLDSDTTTFLAYLKSPPLPTEGDTLNSLYDIYSDIAPSKDVISDSIRNAGLSPPKPSAAQNLSDTSSPASSLRGRVFSPPGKKRSGTLSADSPVSLSSPTTSLNPSSVGRASPFSVPDVRRRPTGRTGSQSSQDEVSKKVPFGFRQSFTLGHPTNSLLMSGQKFTRSVPSSPRKRRPEMPPPSSISNPSRSSTAKGLKPLRLSNIVNSQSKSLSRRSTMSDNTNSFLYSGNIIRTSTSSPTSVSSSSSSNHQPSSSRLSIIPPYVRNSSISSRGYTPSPLSPESFEIPANANGPYSAPASVWKHPRPSSRLSEHFADEFDGDEVTEVTDYHRRDIYDETICRPIPQTAPVARTPAVFHQPVVTPRPTLMFAIASDDVEQVRQVLESGEANPNDCFGPQSALAFTLTNDKLTKKLDIVKTLLSYGADPSTANKVEPPYSSTPECQVPEQSSDLVPESSVKNGMDLATRYYVDRADAAHTQQSSALIHRSTFRSLTRVRYELIGQDRALEQLFRVLSMHSRQFAVAPIVVMLCGPSGHGKSLLARKFGSLLDVPTHTVNMTTLRSTHDLWQSYSMTPYETPTTCTLAEFLINNEGKRCVVVLDEIEKTKEKALWSLLMPWELGRCAFEANKRHVDVRNVIWLGTSNIGHDLVFQHQETRSNPEQLMTREEYINLMALLRPKISKQLGASILSRTTTVLPFVPFTMDEKRAICSEALHNLGGDDSRSLSPEKVEKMVDTALADYCEVEGARSLYRAISNQLADIV